MITLVVARRASRLGTIINSVKNIVDTTQLTVAAATVTSTIVIDTVNDYVGGANEVPIGAKVFGIYLFYQIQQQAVNSNVDWYIVKSPGDQLTLPIPGATGGNVNRKWILHEEKGIPGPSNNGSPPLTFRGVIKLPKHMQRMGEGDRIRIQSRGAAAYDFCFKAIYKFYT